MDSDKTTGPCGLSGSSQCRTVLIRGLRSFPPSGGTQNSQATQQIAKKLLDWPDSTMLGEWELRGHSPVQFSTPVQSRQAQSSHSVLSVI